VSSFFIQQFGCRATQADGAALERQLLDRGCIPSAAPHAADIVVLNTCTVTAAADAQARDAIRKIHAQNPAARLIVTGCYAQRAPEELAALPGVAWVVGNSHKPQIPGLAASLIEPSIPAQSVFEAQHAAPHFSCQPSARQEHDFHPAAFSFFPVGALVPDSTLPFHSFSTDSPAAPQHAQLLVGDIFDRTEFLSAPVLGGESNHTRPILKIQDGCNNRCSFCVIPFVRGRSRSLPPGQVIREIQRLTLGQAFLPVSAQMNQQTMPLQSPAREIVLSGINLGTYGRDLSPRIEFIDLLRLILDETSLERLRISSIEPLDVTQDLIDLFASTDRIARHFHMPLQSASDRILAAMHRWYRSEHYARRAELIHERLPHAAIGADVIAGFPGETEADHAATLAFIACLPFTYLHVFSYSSRPGTKAAWLPNHVSPSIIKRRARELRALGEAKSAAFRRSQIGRTLRVLTLRRDNTGETPSDGTTPALSSNYIQIRTSGEFAANLWLNVRIANKRGKYLVGEPLDMQETRFAESSTLRAV
jgi:threonylcarbamoyladenosine tRNA methylthiotransferase MtaB